MSIDIDSLVIGLIVGHALGLASAWVAVRLNGFRNHASVRYRRAYHSKEGDLSTCWSTQLDDSAGQGIFDTKRLEVIGFLTGECDCEVVLRKTERADTGKLKEVSH